MPLAVTEQFSRPIASGTVILRLPVPPSVNNLFVNSRKGRHPAPWYVAWKRAAGQELIVQRPSRFEGQVEVIITIQEPTKPRDLDNAQKALFDLLVTHQVLPTDDSTCVRKITAAWGDVTGCVVEIVPVGAP